MKLSSKLAFGLLIALLVNVMSLAQDLPTTDRRAAEMRHLDQTFEFPPYAAKADWEKRADFLRGQILFAAGLWPLPEKTPLQAKVFGKTDKGDYTIEKVYFESTPGHYVTGNLYRPKNASGKLPAILCPHGHWAYGRLEHQPLNSGPARAANLARQGYLAFAWDMVGYNDSNAIPHTFANHRETLQPESLWGVNLLGLQLWNAIRAVDFLLTLPDVDPNRIGVTGESGGGTQTFLLAAVDQRIAASAPVNMISSVMQGGSVCENAPLLRIDTNNMELGALTAPRPMMMIAATGDWTKNTPTVEFPAIQGIYRLFDQTDKINFTQFEAPHNYHQPSREAVYGFFANRFLGQAGIAPIKEKSFNIPTLQEMLVFYGMPRPANELNETQLTAALIKAHSEQLQRALPQDAASLAQYKDQYGRGLQYALMAQYPALENIVSTVKNPPGITLIGRKGQRDLVALKVMRPDRKQKVKLDSYVLIASLDSEFVANSQELVAQLLKAGHNVVFMTCYPGKLNKEEFNKFKFQATYNRTDDMNRVQDILTTIAFLQKNKGTAKLSVIGLKEAGLLSLLARGLAPQIDRMVVDAAQLNTNDHTAFLQKVGIPGIRRAGDFTTAVTIAPLTPLLIHNANNAFDASGMRKAYQAFGSETNFQLEPKKLTDLEIVNWLSK